MPRPPSTGAVTSPFGPREAPLPGASTNHLGEDTVGVGNYWPVHGVIVFAGYYGSWGNIIGIRQEPSPEPDGAEVVWWVAHNDSIPAEAKYGKWGDEGDYLAPLGATGNVTGPHAHTERRVGGSYVPGTGRATNPRNYYTAGAGIGGGSSIGDDMPLTEDDLYRIWTFPLKNKQGGPGSISGRAADWLTNMSDSVQVAVDTGKRVETIVKGLGSSGFTPAQIETIAAKLREGLALPTKAEITAAAKAGAEAGTASLGTQLKTVLAEIAKIPAAVLAAFGLKRL